MSDSKSSESSESSNTNGGASESLELGGWALILGASSGFGEAAALAYARAGMSVIGIHLDRRSARPHIEGIQAKIREAGQEALFFNVNAADDAKRAATIESIAEALKERGGKVRVLLHSLAFGTLLPYWSEEEEAKVITRRQIEMTLDVMANSLLYWTQDLLRADLFGADARIFAMTSAGNRTVWPGYGAVSAAKCALEAHIRQLAIELAPRGITANAICAGVTDTPALQKIPGSDKMKEQAAGRNPYGRLTTTADVAGALLALSTPATRWITGNTIWVDGGETIAG